MKKGQKVIRMVFIFYSSNPNPLPKGARGPIAYPSKKVSQTEIDRIQEGKIGIGWV